MKSLLNILIFLTLSSLTFAQTIYTAEKDWFQRISEGEIQGYLIYEKFGENEEITTASDPEDVWDGGGIYNWDIGGGINKFSSDNASDTEEILVQGLGTGWQLLTDTITLNGQNTVTSDSTFYRVFRMINIGDDNLIGEISCCTNGTTFTDGVPDQSDSVRAKIVNGNNQTLMCLFTIPAGHTGYFWGGYVSSSTGGVSGQTIVFTWRARLFGGVFAVKSKIACVGNGVSSWSYQYKAPIELPEKTDILIRCEEVSATMGVSGGFTVILKED